MKIWKIIKFFVYIISAIMIAIFNLEIVENLKYLIGFLMIIYGLEPVIIHFATRKKFTEHTKFYWGAIEILLGFVVLFLVSDYATICVIWGIWSILRETHEIEECVHMFIHKNPVAVISLVESIVVIVFSITLILEPGEHHALIHVYLLCAELLTTVTLPLLEDLYLKQKEKNKK